MLRVRICLLLLLVLSFSKPVSAGAPADPVDALANAIPHLAKWFCKKVGVGYHAANEIFHKERKKYPKGVNLTLHFRISRAQMSLEDKSLGCIMSFEPYKGTVGPFEPNVLTSKRIQISAVNATGLGPPITHFPNVTLRIDPLHKRVPLGEKVYFSNLFAKFTVNGRVYEIKMRPNDAIWDTSDKEAVTPIPAIAPGTGLVMAMAGGAQAQGFSTHNSGQYSIIANLPSGASTYATVDVLPNEELTAYWIVRHHAKADGCSLCFSGKMQVRFDAEGKAASGKFQTDCTKLICSGLPPHILCPMPSAQKAQMSGRLLNLRTDVDARILKANLKSAAAQANELGSLTGDFQRVGNAPPYEYLGSGRLQVPVMVNNVQIGWAQGTWHSKTPLACSR